MNETYWNSSYFCDILLNQNPVRLQSLFIIEIIHIILIIFTIIYFVIYTKNRDILTDYIMTVFKQVQHTENYESVDPNEPDIDMNILSQNNTSDNHLELSLEQE